MGAIPQRHGSIETIVETDLKSGELFVTDTDQLFVGIPDNSADPDGSTYSHPLFGALDSNPLQANTVTSHQSAAELPLNGSFVTDKYLKTSALKLPNDSTQFDFNHTVIKKSKTATSKNALPVGLWRVSTGSSNVLQRLKSTDVDAVESNASALQHAPGLKEVGLDRVLHPGMRVVLVATTLRNSAGTNGSQYGSFQIVYSSQWTGSTPITTATHGFTSDSQVATIRSVNASTGTIALDSNSTLPENTIISLFPIANSLTDKQVSLYVDNIVNHQNTNLIQIGSMPIITESWNERNRIGVYTPNGRYDASRVYNTAPYTFKGKTNYGFQIISRDPTVESSQFPWSDSVHDETDPQGNGSYTVGGVSQYFPAIRESSNWNTPANSISLKIPLREAVKNATYSQRCRMISAATTPQNEWLSNEKAKNVFDYRPKESGFILDVSFIEWLSVGRTVEFLPHQEFLPSHEGEAGYGYSIAPPSDPNVDWALSDTQSADDGRQTLGNLFRNYVRWGESFSKPAVTIRQILNNERDHIGLVVTGRSLTNDNPDPTTNPDIESFNVGKSPGDQLPTGALEAVLPAAQGGYEQTNTRLYLAETLEAQEFIFEPGPYPRIAGIEPWLNSVSDVNQTKSKIWHTVFELPIPGHNVDNIIDWIGFLKPIYGLLFDTVGQQALELGKLVVATQPFASKIELKAAEHIHLTETDAASSEYRASRPKDTNDDVFIVDSRVFIDNNPSSGLFGKFVIQVYLNQEIEPLDYNTSNKYFHQQSTPNRLVFSFVDNVPAVVLDELVPGTHNDHSEISGEISTTHLDSDLQYSGMGLVEIDRTSLIRGVSNTPIVMLRLHPVGFEDLWSIDSYLLEKGLGVGDAPTISDSQYGVQRTRYIHLSTLEMRDSDFENKTVYGFEPSPSRWKQVCEPNLVRLIEEDNNSEYTNSSGLASRPVNDSHAIIQGGGRQIINADLVYSGSNNIVEISPDELYSSIVLVDFDTTGTPSTTKENCAINQVLTSLENSGFLSGDSWSPVEAPVDEFSGWDAVLSALILPDPRDVPNGTTLKFIKRSYAAQNEYTALCFKWRDDVNAIGIPWIRNFALKGDVDEPLYGPKFTENSEPNFCIVPLIPNGGIIEVVFYHDEDNAYVDFIGATESIINTVYKK